MALGGAERPNEFELEAEDEDPVADAIRFVAAELKLGESLDTFTQFIGTRFDGAEGFTSERESPGGFT
jgi:hypothetical protein